MSQVTRRPVFEVRGPGEYSAAEIDELIQSGLTHAFMQHHQGRDLAAEGARRIMVKGEGIYLYDVDGKRYIDGMAGLYLMNLGHGQTEIIDAISDQLRMLAYANTGAHATIPAIRLAEKLASIMPDDLNKVFFCNGGSEAVDIAMKMAKQIQFMRGFPKKTKIVARRNSYHGSTYAPMSLTGRARTKGMFEPLMPGVHHVEQPSCYRCPWGLNDDGRVSAAGMDCPGEGCCMQAVKDFERLIEFEGAETIAAFIATVNSTSGQLPPPGYWKAIRELCDKHDILLIDDEIICGFGRLGKWFGIEHWDVVPDIMTVAKALTGGYQPCGAVVCRDEWARLFDEKDEVFHHGVTYGSHPGVMAAGVAALEIMEREGVVENSARMGAYLWEQAMERLHDRHPSVGFVGGGYGLLASVSMVKNRETKAQYDEEYGKALTAKVRERGLALRAANEIWLSPPLTIDKAQINEILDILDDAITAQENEFEMEA
jgi:adenosylmethionine-8-amino-7-oxononanoate aminotransferase